MSAVAAAGTGAVRHRGTVARVQAELAAVLEHVRCKPLTSSSRFLLDPASGHSLPAWLRLSSYVRVCVCAPPSPLPPSFPHPLGWRSRRTTTPASTTASPTRSHRSVGSSSSRGPTASLNTAHTSSAGCVTRTSTTPSSLSSPTSSPRTRKPPGHDLLPPPFLSVQLTRTYVVGRMDIVPPRGGSHGIADPLRVCAAATTGHAWRSDASTHRHRHRHRALQRCPAPLPLRHHAVVSWEAPRGGTREEGEQREEGGLGAPAPRTCSSAWRARLGREILCIAARAPAGSAPTAGG
jgi:hypothetical protein